MLTREVKEASHGIYKNLLQQRFSNQAQDYQEAIRIDRKQVLSLIFGGEGLPAEAQQDFDRAPSDVDAHFLVAGRRIRGKQERQIAVLAECISLISPLWQWHTRTKKML